MADIDETLQRIHDRIDSIAKDVHTLQLTTVKRDGPIVTEIRNNSRTLDRMKDNLLTKDDFRKAMEADEYRTFNRNDRIVATVIAVGMAVLQTASVAILIIYHH